MEVLFGRTLPALGIWIALRRKTSASLANVSSCSTWDGINNKLTEKVQKLQNRAARVITKSSYEVSSSLLLDALGWEKLISNRRNHKAIMVFKSLHNLAPMYFHNM